MVDRRRLVLHPGAMVGVCVWRGDFSITSHWPICKKIASPLMTDFTYVKELDGSEKASENCMASFRSNKNHKRRQTHHGINPLIVCLVCKHNTNSLSAVIVRCCHRGQLNQLLGYSRNSHIWLLAHRAHLGPFFVLKSSSPNVIEALRQTRTRESNGYDYITNSTPSRLSKQNVGQCCSVRKHPSSSLEGCSTLCEGRTD